MAMKHDLLCDLYHHVGEDSLPVIRRPVELELQYTVLDFPAPGRSEGKNSWSDLSANGFWTPKSLPEGAALTVQPRIQMKTMLHGE